MLGYVDWREGQGPFLTVPFFVDPMELSLSAASLLKC